MAKKDKLTEVSVKIGSTLGKIDKQAHAKAKKVAEAGKVAQEDLKEIRKQVDALTKQLAKTTQRLKKALS